MDSHKTAKKIPEFLPGYLKILFSQYILLNDRSIKFNFEWLFTI